MTIYKIGLDEIGAEDGEAWVSLQALPSGVVAVDSYMEPRLGPDDLRALRDWIDQRLTGGE